ncbi:hypothetical protein R1flu_013232 [Riccia fluitans]|uniref:Uncharacterized protein n=1 Tax=Riccia fluitans TaxID=41844 RepID=A0ABD1YCQ8_9MARC
MATTMPRPLFFNFNTHDHSNFLSIAHSAPDPVPFYALSSRPLSINRFRSRTARLWKIQGLGFNVRARASRAESDEKSHFQLKTVKFSFWLGGFRLVHDNVTKVVCRAGGDGGRGALRWGRSESLRRDEEGTEFSGAGASEEDELDEDDEDEFDADGYDPEDEIVGFNDEDETEFDDMSPDLEAEHPTVSSRESITKEREIRESTSALIAQLCERIQAGGETAVTTQAISNLYDFPFDKFQRMAIDGFLKGSSVVVCAPTSSGKTLIAEAAAVATLAKGKKMFYTTPLKALSNQKLREFRKLFGESNVGLLTGDAAVNRDAPILVMTTEILRNMLYQSAGDADDEGGRLENVSAVVLDEVHYLSDISRGTVWEETVIYCPKSVQLICLSATVANPEDLAGWIAQVHGPTELVTSSRRPVPLMWHFSTKYVLQPLLNEQGTEMNYRLSLTDPSQNTSNSSSFWDVDEGSKGRRSSEGRRRSSGFNGSSRGDENGSGRRRGDSRRDELPEEVVAILRRRQVPQVRDTLQQLVARDMLPAIWFIFSRRGCDTAVKYLSESSLLTEDESLQVREAIIEFQQQHPDAVRESAVEPLTRGVAAHHAGCLPTWKAFVEELFQRGLVKVVFATETLSAGINMPARTTVLSSLSKRGDNGQVLLSSNAMLQMAGRAGRRGIDEQGHVVVVQTPFEGAEDCCKLLFAGSDPIVSQFTATYGMALNLLAGGKVQKLEGNSEIEEPKTVTFGRTMSQARELIEQSFGNYVGSEVMVAAKKQLAKLEQEVERLVQKTQAVDGTQTLESRLTKTEMQTYLSFKEAVKERKANLLKMRKELENLRVSAFESLLDEAATTQIPYVCICYFDPRTGSENLITARLVGTVPKPPFIVFSRPDKEEEGGSDTEKEELPSKDPVYHVALGPDNRWYLFTAKSVKGYSKGDLEENVSGIVPGKVVREILKGKLKFGARSWQALGKAGTDVSSAVWVADSSPETKTWSSEISPSIDYEVPEDLQIVEAVVAQERKQIALLRKKLKMTLGYKENQQLVVLQRSRLEKIVRLKQKASKLATRISQMAPSGWNEFLQDVEVLNAAGAIDLANCELLPLGQTASGVRGENELWLAMVFSSERVRSLTSPQLAAVCGTLVSDGIKTRPEYGHSVMYEASTAVQEWVDSMESEKARLLALQAEHGVYIPCLMDIQFAGMVEAWAAGVTWKELMTDCGMDEGDVARLLRRSIDLLAQIPHLPHVDSGIVKLARQATHVMDRPPISELLG